MLTVFKANLLPLLLGLNTLLILVDAAIGYHLAPFLLQRGEGDEGGAEGSVHGVRRLLSLLVALYMFFSCLAFARQQLTYLALVTCILLLDIAIQLILRRRYTSGAGH